METIVVVGLGYVGLPLAVAFGKKQQTIGFDLSSEKVERIKNGIDLTGEVPEEELKTAKHITYTSNPRDIEEGSVFVVAVPTPIDSAKKPDFGPLIGASKIVGQHMKPGSLVIYESTVYPGATEEVCVPLLEEVSGLKWKQDFHVGYSPERINPGDPVHRLENIVKVVSADDEDNLDRVTNVYESVVDAGVHRASSIRVAEAAKVIENTQRDLNIALMNELALIFGRIGIDTVDVLEAAGTKWNFLPFRPGLVGGHCIGVDPYYLTHKAEMVGYTPQVILAGRRINDGMGVYIAERTIKAIAGGIGSGKAIRIAVLGLTFKEDCPDLRNSRVIDVIAELKTFGVEVIVHDPVAEVDEAKKEYDVDLVDWDDIGEVQAMVVAVAHKRYRDMPKAEFLERLDHGGAIIDVKAMFPADHFNGECNHWRL